MQKKHTLCLFLVLLTCFVSCQKDELVPIEQELTTQRLIVRADDIPDVKNTLLKKMGITSGDAKLFSANQGEQQSVLSIDWENIRQLIDTTGRETYTFAIKNTDPDPHVFYNLVLRYNADHEAHQPYILKYTMDENFLDEYLETKSMENFRGKVQKIVINDPLGDNHLRGRPSLDLGDDSGGLDLGDPCPNDTSIGGGGDPGSGGAGTWECRSVMVTTTWYSQTCTPEGCDPPVQIGEEQSIVTECGYFNENNSADANNDCDPDEGEIPIIVPDIINRLLDPCLKSTAEMLINKDLTNDINTIVQDIFNMNNKVNLVLKENPRLPKPGSAQVDPTVTNGNLNINLFLNPNMLTGSSKEYIASIIYHEILHALLLTNGPSLSNLEEHMIMAENLMNELIAAFQEVFPNMSLQLARGLSIRGFGNIVTQEPDYFNDLLEELDFEDLQEVLDLTDPHRDGNAGTSCT